MPPSLRPGPSRIGPATAPGGNPGNAMAAEQKVRLALTALQEALPGLPMGTAIHTEVLKAVKAIGGKLGDQGDSSKSLQMQQLMQMMKGLASQPNPAMARLGGAPPGAPPAPPQPPAMPPSAPPGMAEAA